MSISKSNLVCLIVGAAVGVGGMLVVAPSETKLKAASTDRTTKFAVATCPADITNEREAVFVLDFLNSRIIGGIIDNRTGKYLHRYYREIGNDFKLDPNTPEPEFAIVGARANLSGNFGKGVVHVAEKSSGAMIAYAFNMPNRPNPNNTLGLEVLDFIQFREQ